MRRTPDSDPNVDKKVLSGVVIGRSPGLRKHAQKTRFKDRRGVNRWKRPRKT